MNLPMIPHPAQRQVSPPPPPLPPTNKQSKKCRHFCIRWRNLIKIFSFPSGGLNHACPSCGICFSSASTLAAHATYYCSKRPQPPNAAQPPPPTAPPAAAANSDPVLPAHPEAIGTPLSNGNRSLTPDQHMPDDLVTSARHHHKWMGRPTFLFFFPFQRIDHRRQRSAGADATTPVPTVRSVRING